MKRRYDWEGILEYAFALEGPRNIKERYEGLRKAFADGRFRGRCPVYETFWRRYTERTGTPATLGRAERAEGGATSSSGEPADLLVAASAECQSGAWAGDIDAAMDRVGSSVSVFTRIPEHTTVAGGAQSTAIARLGEETAPSDVAWPNETPTSQAADAAADGLRDFLLTVENQMREVMTPLLVHCPHLIGASTTLDFQRFAKRLRTARQAPRLTPADREHETEHLARHASYQARLGNAVRAFVDEFRPILRYARENGLIPQYADAKVAAALGEAPASDTPCMGSLPEIPAPRTPFTYAAPGEWGRHRATELQPAYGATVGRSAEDAPRQRARFRRQLIMPVLNGQLTPREVVEAVGRYVREMQTRDDELHFGTLDAPLLLQYRKLRVRTVQRWVAQCRRALREADEAQQSPPSLTTVLEHRNRTRDASRPKRTPETVKLVLKEFKDTQERHTALSAAEIARLMKRAGLADISERTAQRIIAEEITDLDRILHRAGPAGTDVLVRSRLKQAATRPNQAWLLDHTFILLEHIDSDHPEYIDQVQPFVDLPFEYVLERRNFHGVYERVRKRGVYATVIIDACTRYPVGFALWDRVPTAEMTLSILYDAMVEHGIPELVYTDNGSDFRSGLVREALFAVGVKQVFSMPYTPEGRGLIERWFRTLKDMIAPYLVGFTDRSGNSVAVAVEDLPTLVELEERCRHLIEILYSHAIHGETKRKPAEHFHALIGARAIVGARTEDLIQLLPTQVVRRSTEGVLFRGIPYWSPRLSAVPIGAEIVLHVHPRRWKTVLLSVISAEGTYDFLDVAEYYDIDHPAPGIAERQHLVGAFLEQVQEDDLGFMQRQASRARTEAITKAGGELADALAGAAGEEAGLLGGHAHRLALPAPTIPSATEGAPPPHTPAAPSVPGRDPEQQPVGVALARGNAAHTPVADPARAPSPSSDTSVRRRRSRAELIVNPLD